MIYVEFETQQGTKILFRLSAIQALVPDPKGARIAVEGFEDWVLVTTSYRDAKAVLERLARLAADSA